MRSVIWRVAAGDEDKDLVPLMLRDQVMLIGPGSAGNIANMTDTDVLKLSNAKRRDLQYLVAFRTDARKGHIVVLRLGSVCFSVGVITSDYFYEDKYAEVYSFWNSDKKFYPKEDSWDLRHARQVKWFGLIDPEALCHFRKGIYGGPQRFCRVGDGGKQISASAKQHLDDYLWDKLKYNNENGDGVLSKIGKPCAMINKFGFPTP
ncbi:MAG: hypothetical protein HY268_33580 [Deltaproteobacteria bacterium]|nr:hypothetical protein [Deltaproteobacteria bacterium]